MRSVVTIFALLGAGLVGAGCKSGPIEPPTPTPTAAAALAFTPPVAYANPPLDLDRESRAPGAYVGYDSAQVSYFYIHQDDSFRFGSGSGWDVPSYFERRSETVTTGMRVR